MLNLEDNRFLVEASCPRACVASNSWALQLSLVEF
jgi:hypothetical protein